MRHAILMTVYKDAELINFLLNKFYCDFDIYIHIDKKSSLTANQIIKSPKIRVYKEFSIKWGGNNHTKAILMLLAESRKKNYDYYHIVTGQDVCLDPKNIDSYLEYGYSYLEFFKIPSKGFSYNGGLWRVQYFCFFDVFNAKNPWQYKLIKYLIKFQHKLHLIRKRDYSKLWGGSGYCSLYKKDVEVILQESSQWSSYFKHTFCSEEFLFQTILCNSPRKDFIINNNLRYIDWSSLNPPKIWGNNDIDKILKSNMLFARKVDYNISKKLFNTILNEINDYNNML